MNKLSFSSLCQIYLLLLLLAATILSSLSYSVLALILLLGLLFITFRPLEPRLSVAIFTGVIFLLPLLLQPVVHYLADTTLLSPTLLQFMAAVAISPVIYLLDYNLRQNAQDMTLAHSVKERHITAIPTALFVSILVIVLVSLIISNRVLLFTGAMVALYLLFILIRVLLATRRPPLDVSAVWKRIIAGNTADITLYATSKASIRLHFHLSPVDSWVEIKLQRFTLNRAKIELNLTITPPLAGPTHPELRLSIIDPWGLIQLNRVIEPVELHVIPRARYAEWLAMMFLKQSWAGGTIATDVPLEAVLASRRGIEYFGSRTYQPGDQLKAIDWKHTLKLNTLIIKEYIEANEQTAIIAVNLSVTDAEEADKIAFNIITTALTLAQKAIPTALAAYDHERVIATTALTDPRETLIQTLLLVKEITTVEFAHRFLQPPDINKLRRNITLLKQVSSPSAQRLLSMLEFEYQAMEEAAKKHPATLALSRTIKQIQPPAIILLVSQLNHDTEALLVTSEKLSERGFTTIPIAAAKPNLRRTLS